MNQNKKTNHNLRSAIAVILVALLATVILFALSAFNVTQYRWAFELVVLVAAVCAVYYILRTGYYEYGYSIVDGNLIFNQKMGKGERFVFALDLKTLRRVMDRDTAYAEILRRGLKGVPKYYIDKNEGEEYGLLYYDEASKCEKILTFKPSADLIEILSKKALDNTTEM